MHNIIEFIVHYISYDDPIIMESIDASSLVKVTPSFNSIGNFKDLFESDIAFRLLPYLGLIDSVRCYILLTRECYKRALLWYNVHKDVEKAKLLIPSGMKFNSILDYGRFCCFDQRLQSIRPDAEAAVRRSGHLQVLRCPQFYSELNALNVAMYTYMDATSFDPTRGIYDDLVAINKMKDFKDNWGNSLEEDVIYWTSSRVVGNFIVLFERPDGTIMVSDDYQHVYLVLGIAQSLGDVTNISFEGNTMKQGKPFGPPKFHSPLFSVVIFTTLLNWDGKIVYDGLLMPQYKPSPSTMKRAINAYINAVNNGTLFTKLEKKAPSRFNSKLKISDEEVNALEISLRADLQSIRSKRPFVKKFEDSDYSNMKLIVFRRHGYTEQENPDHMISVMNPQFGAMPMKTFFSKNLIPTVQECIKALKEIVVKHDIDSICFDAIEVVVPIQKLLEGSTKFKISYYPPPSEEENLRNDLTNPMGGITACKWCKATHGFDGAPLFTCSRCKATKYCSKEHQKLDWPSHKKLCNNPF